MSDVRGTQILTADELAYLRAKPLDELDELDIGVLFDHIDACAELNARNQRIVDLVTAPGSQVHPSVLNPGYVVVFDGRNNADACEKSTGACFDALFEEQDGGMSPGRMMLKVWA